MSFNVENIIVNDTIIQTNYSNNQIDTVDVTTGYLTIDPMTPYTYIINNTNGASVTLQLPNTSFAGQQKFITVTSNNQSGNLTINYTNNYGNSQTTNTFGNVGDIIQFVASTKGWGIPWFDIK